MRCLTLIVSLSIIVGCDQSPPPAVEAAPQERSQPMNRPDKIIKSDDEWKALLTPQQFHVLREKGTEPPFSHEYKDAKKDEIFVCAACDLPLFDAKHKFESGTGWPSFWKPIDPANVAEKPDYEHGMTRTEVLCARCDGHLGHIFADGPPPTGLRYCMNGVAMKLAARPKE